MGKFKCAEFKAVRFYRDGQRLTGLVVRELPLVVKDQVLQVSVIAERQEGSELRKLVACVPFEQEEVIQNHLKEVGIELSYKPNYVEKDLEIFYHHGEQLVAVTDNLKELKTLFLSTTRSRT